MRALRDWGLPSEARYQHSALVHLDRERKATREHTRGSLRDRGKDARGARKKDANCNNSMTEEVSFSPFKTPRSTPSRDVREASDAAQQPASSSPESQPRRLRNQNRGKADVNWPEERHILVPVPSSIFEGSMLNASDYDVFADSFTPEQLREHRILQQKMRSIASHRLLEEDALFTFKGQVSMDGQKRDFICKYSNICGCKARSRLVQWDTELSVVIEFYKAEHQHETLKAKKGLSVPLRGAVTDLLERNAALKPQALLHTLRKEPFSFVIGDLEAGQVKNLRRTVLKRLQKEGGSRFGEFVSAVDECNLFSKLERAQREGNKVAATDAGVIARFVDPDAATFAVVTASPHSLLNVVRQQIRSHWLGFMDVVIDSTYKLSRERAVKHVTISCTDADGLAHVIAIAMVTEETARVFRFCCMAVDAAVRKLTAATSVPFQLAEGDESISFPVQPCSRQWPLSRLDERPAFVEVNWGLDEHEDGADFSPQCFFGDTTSGAGSFLWGQHAPDEPKYLIVRSDFDEAIKKGAVSAVPNNVGHGGCYVHAIRNIIDAAKGRKDGVEALSSEKDVKLLHARFMEMVFTLDRKIFVAQWQANLQDMRDGGSESMARYLDQVWGGGTWSFSHYCDSSGEVLLGVPGHTNAHEGIHHAYKVHQDRVRMRLTEAFHSMLSFLRATGDREAQRGFTATPNALGEGEAGVKPQKHRETFLRAQSISGYNVGTSSTRVRDHVPSRSCFRRGQWRYFASNYMMDYLSFCVENQSLNAAQAPSKLRAWFRDYARLLDQGPDPDAGYDVTHDLYRSFYRFSVRDPVPQSLMQEAWRGTDADFGLVLCTCPAALKRRLCKHSLAIGFSSKMFAVPRTRSAARLSLPLRGQAARISRALELDRAEADRRSHARRNARSGGGGGDRDARGRSGNAGGRGGRGGEHAEESDREEGHDVSWGGSRVGVGESDNEEGRDVSSGGSAQRHRQRQHSADHVAQKGPDAGAKRRRADEHDEDHTGGERKRRRVANRGAERRRDDEYDEYDVHDTGGHRRGRVADGDGGAKPGDERELRMPMVVVLKNPRHKGHRGRPE